MIIFSLESTSIKCFDKILRWVFFSCLWSLNEPTWKKRTEEINWKVNCKVSIELPNYRSVGEVDVSSRWSPRLQLHLKIRKVSWRLNWQRWFEARSWSDRGKFNDVDAIDMTCDKKKETVIKILKFLQQHIQWCANV